AAATPASAGEASAKGEATEAESVAAAADATTPVAAAAGSSPGASPTAASPAPAAAAQGGAAGEPAREVAAGRPASTEETTAAPASAAMRSARAASLEERLRTRSSPLVRRMAAEHGINLRRIAGSGRLGRVTKADVLAYLQNGGAEGAAPHTRDRAAE